MKVPLLLVSGFSHPLGRELGAGECYGFAVHLDSVESPFSNSRPLLPRLLPSAPSNRLEDRGSGSGAGDPHCPSLAGFLCQPEVGKKHVLRFFWPPDV